MPPAWWSTLDGAAARLAALQDVAAAAPEWRDWALQKFGAATPIDAALQAWNEGADPVLLVRALWAMSRNGGAVDGAVERAGPDRLAQLRRALTLLERHASGDGRRAALELAAALMTPDEDKPARPRGGGPSTWHGDAELQTLAGVAATLHAIGRKWRRAQRERAGELGPRARRPDDGVRPMLPKRARGWEWPWY